MVNTHTLGVWVRECLFDVKGYLWGHSKIVVSTHFAVFQEDIQEYGPSPLGNWSTDQTRGVFHRKGWGRHGPQGGQKHGFQCYGYISPGLPVGVAHLFSREMLSLAARPVSDSSEADHVTMPLQHQAGSARFISRLSEPLWYVLWIMR